MSINVDDSDGPALLEFPDFGVLSGEYIRQFNTELFASGFDPGAVKGAAYELHVAPTKLVIPSDNLSGDHSQHESERYPEGQMHRGSFDIAPGQMAFVSSKEKLRLARNVCGVVSIKFTFAISGILMLMGMNVDPAYGSDVPDGRRLHFVLVNVSSKSVTIEPEVTAIAALQFLPVIGRLPEGTSNVPRAPRAIDGLFDSKAPLGLELFNRPRQVEERLQTELADVGQHLDQRLERLEGNVREVMGLKQVVMFGYFLLGTVMLGTVLTFLVGLFGQDKILNTVHRAVNVAPHSWPGSVAVIAVAFAASATLLGLPLVLARSRLKTESKK